MTAKPTRRKTPKDRTIEFRVTAAHKEQLERMARTMGLTRGDGVGDVSKLIRRRFPEVFAEPGTLPAPVARAGNGAAAHGRGLFEPTAE